jgi:Fur family ferric uptake transcriptional regulator
MDKKDLEKLAAQRGLKVTGPRKVILQILMDSTDHPDVEEVYKRASQIDPKISIATVYRTLDLFEELGLIIRHHFGDGKTRVEENWDHHHHLINVETGEILEFQNEQLEKLKQKICEEMGFKMVDCRVELFGVPKNKLNKWRK